jgi:hypothetical protein
METAHTDASNSLERLTMRTLRLVVASLLFAASMLATPVFATAYSTDQSDLWYIPAEAGWGIQLVHRGSLIFFTMFVYDPTGKPIWYVGTISPSIPLVWSGDMYVTNGPWFGTQPYDPAQFGGRIVGTLTWSPTLVQSGKLSYTVDGVVVHKDIVRQTLVNDDYSGRYAGALHEDFFGCANLANNNMTVENVGILAIAQTGNSITLTATPVTGGSCTYSGTLSQFGQMGAISGGSYSCTNGTFGNFVAYELQVNITGITGRFSDSATALQCSGTGWFGGVHTTLY